MTTKPGDGATASTKNEETALISPFSELRGLIERATKGPWEHMRGRGLVRAIRGDVAVPIFEPLEPYGDPLLEDAPTVRVGNEVIFRARSQGARQSAALAQQHYNAALIVAAVNALPALLDERDRLIGENERLRLEMMGGEDAPGYAASMSLDNIILSFREHQSFMRSVTEARALSAEAEARKLALMLKDRSPCVLGCETVCGQPYADPDERLKDTPCCVARSALSDQGEG